MKTKIKLFTLGALQVFCIVLNTWLISHDYWALSIASQFAITLIWTFNVQKIACSTMAERITHALGATVGSAIVWALVSIFNITLR